MITFLGFILDSIQMLVRPTLEKAQKLKTTCEKLLTKPEVTVQELAEAIGTIVSNFPGVDLGPCFTKGWNETKVVPSNKVKGTFRPNSNCPQIHTYIHTFIEAPFKGLFSHNILKITR